MWPLKMIVLVDSLVVPGGQQLLLQLTESSTLAFRGTTKFGFAKWKGNLVVITGCNITVYGEKDSLLDGQGPLWWDGQGSWGNVTKPKFFRIKNTNNSIFYDINIKNCPMGCTQIELSENVTLRNWKIDISDGDEGVAPENKFGHNTDGFGISKSQNILIEDAVVHNQDDCVVINSGKNITARNLFCYGGHGLSISDEGSVVEDVVFENCTVTNSENGIHVKTCVDAGHEQKFKDLDKKSTELKSKIDFNQKASGRGSNDFGKLSLAVDRDSDAGLKL
ncbi:unnamed protein product [Ceutorhynchus assimilis]|uniref:endo-polygalacturonase n=1 Tax=Ceutorhynchus assimilis TaxID=467358 RepID=A0A9N9MZW4_9CUCU|nr:unnamed protein product [Ceutorhynchus assimilis]